MEASQNHPNETDQTGTGPAVSNSRPRTRWMQWHVGRDVLMLILMGFAAVGGVIGASTGIASLSQVENVRASQERLLDGTPEQSAKFADNNPSNPHLTLVSENRERYVDLVVGSNHAQAWTLNTNLSTAESGKQYQIWVRANDETFPVAFAGKTLTNVYFTFPATATSVFITQEPEDGSLQPTGSEIVSAVIPVVE